MWKWFIWWSMLLIGLAVSAKTNAADRAELSTPPAAAAAATQPATPAKEAPVASPTATPTATPTTAEEWLDVITHRLADVKSMQASVRWDRIQGLLGDEQRRWGTIVYVAGPPARFSVHFTRLLVDGEGREQDRRYIFDGRWLVERNPSPPKPLTPARMESNFLSVSVGCSLNRH